jgi:hypothetical protein
MPGASPALAIGNSPIPTKVVLPIVKTDSSLIYRNETLMTIKVNIGKTNEKFTAANL